MQVTWVPGPPPSPSPVRAISAAPVLVTMTCDVITGDDPVIQQGHSLQTNCSAKDFLECRLTQPLADL